MPCLSHLRPRLKPQVRENSQKENNDYHKVGLVLMVCIFTMTCYILQELTPGCCLSWPTSHTGELLSAPPPAAPAPGSKNHGWQSAYQRLSKAVDLARIPLGDRFS